MKIVTRNCVFICVRIRIIVRTYEFHEVLLEGGLGEVGRVPSRPGHLLLGGHLGDRPWTLSPTTSTCHAGCTAWCRRSRCVPTSSLSGSMRTV